MTLEEINRRIKGCAAKMNDLYGKVVFDELAVVSLAQQKARVLAYTGPRNDEFLLNFARDLGALRAQLVTGHHGVGDFEFTRHGQGTSLEAFLVLGNGIYLFCNNTQRTMDEIAREDRWLSAQVPFVELAEAVRASPVTWNP